MSVEVIILENALNFIYSLPLKLRSKSLRTINMLEKFGHELCEPYSKTLKNCNGLKELRTKQGSNICRMFYFHKGDRVYVVTSGYLKKSMKTDRRQISKALEIMKRYLEE